MRGTMIRNNQFLRNAAQDVNPFTLARAKAAGDEGVGLRVESGGFVNGQRANEALQVSLRRTSELGGLIRSGTLRERNKNESVDARGWSRRNGHGDGDTASAG